MSIRSRIRTIEERHPIYAPLTRFENECRQRIAIQRVIEKLCERTLNECIHFLILIAQRICMLHICRKPFEPICGQLAQTADILILRCKYANRLGLCFKVCTGRCPMRRLRELGRIADLCEELAFQHERLFDDVHDRLTVKVRIRNRHKEIQRHTMVDRDLHRLALGAQLRRDGTQTFGYIDEQILHLSDIRLLTADSLHCAGLAACGLLTLVAKHFRIHGKLSFAHTYKHNTQILRSL